MAKSNSKNSSKNSRRAVMIQDTAEIVGVTPRSVQRVLSADQENREVLDTFMVVKEFHNEFHNQLIERVRQMVPFPTEKA